MIDDFIIFERGGSVLWRRTFVRLRGDPIATLIREVLLEDRASDAELSTATYGVRWSLSNEHRLVIAVVFQRLLPPAYAGELLESVKGSFTEAFGAALAAGEGDDADFSAFDTTFDDLLHAAEQSSLRRAREARERRTARNNAPRAAPRVAPADDRAHSPPDSRAPDSRSLPAPPLSTPPLGGASAEDETRRNREAFIRRRTAAKKKSSKMTTGTTILDTPVEPPKRGKVMRPPRSSVADEAPRLDFSAPAGANGGDDAEVERVRRQFKEGASNAAYDLLDVSDEEDGATGDAPNGKSRTLASGVLSYFKGLAGMRALTRDDIEPALAQFREALIGKNVAQDIADRLLESVATSLEGQQMESMTSVTTTMKRALDEALTRILTPRQSTDILADISAMKGNGRPYVITYCGVNGVGKSTSLAKTCYLLIENGFKVLIAACDTFRAGAVEQLRTHVKCLGKGVELFDRGYGKDAAAVANDAIRRAKEGGFDVVLVDTAGRMQDNEPLMRALAKLVEVNRPDRLFFVGEALVGNDAVDQLKKFNAALSDHQRSANPRLIDGIVLTKFDTIDDKVGAAVSMVYTTGQPIVFVGVGQTYMDLRKMNTKALVRALLR